MLNILPWLINFTSHQFESTGTVVVGFHCSASVHAWRNRPKCIWLSSRRWSEKRWNGSPESGRQIPCENVEKRRFIAPSPLEGSSCLARKPFLLWQDLNETEYLTLLEAAFLRHNFLVEARQCLFGEGLEALPHPFPSCIEKNGYGCFRK